MTNHDINVLKIRRQTNSTMKKQGKETNKGQDGNTGEVK